MQRSINLISNALLVAASLSCAVAGAQNPDETAIDRAGTAQLDITVTGIGTHSGNVLIGVGDMAKPQSMHGAVVPSADSVTVVLTDLDAGPCGVYVFLDENGNYQLDRNADGPAEGCCLGRTTLNEGANRLRLTLQFPNEMKTTHPETELK